MRSIAGIHSATEAPIDDLITFRALPSATIDHIDPFLFLNHHGPQLYPPDNNGLPFGPHPHRGFETLTFILQGDLLHWDSEGGKSVIKAGGIQWMTAGRGLVHAEISSEEFKKKGGKVEIIQLWLNLPAHLKMIEPRYIGKQKEEIPVVTLENHNVCVNLISGTWCEKEGAVESLTDIEISSIEFAEGSSFRTFIPKHRNILLYVVSGLIEVNTKNAAARQLVEFQNDHEAVEIKAPENSLIILGHGEPFHEPIVSQGPFVMNSQEQIRQAWLDYRQGKMGSLTSFP